MKKTIKKSNKHPFQSFEEAYRRILFEQVEQTSAPVPPAAPAEDEGDGLMTICFKTADPTIIDVFKSGFAKATFDVFTKEGEADEATTPVDVDGTLISDIQVTDPVCPECGNDPCTCEQDEECDEQDEECDEQDEECDEQDEECDEQDEECDEQDEPPACNKKPYKSNKR